jgi:metallo-beta-lactamase family protein
MFQGRREEAYLKNVDLPFDPRELSAVVLTHAHFDHCGNSPSLVKGGYGGNLYSTPATRDLANLIMMDSAHIMAKDFQWLRQKHSDKVAYEPIYDQDDAVQTINQFVTVNYNRHFPLGNGISCEFYDAGHILGSSVAILTIGEGRQKIRIAMTGDLGRWGQPILRDPAEIPDVDYLVCEGTYGDRLHDPIEDAQQQLGQVIRETVEKGGNIIIPAFAVGRTQELIYYLHLLKDAGQIPDIEMFVDSPMAVNATSIFRVHPECYDRETHQAFLDHHRNPFGFEGLRYISDVSQSKQLNQRNDPCIIMSASGMCEAGRILHHLKNNITDSRNTVLVVGFMAEHTLGRAIADRREQVSIFGQKYPLKARVKILNTFSAHADYEDIKRYVRRLNLKRLKKVFLVHGEAKPLEHLKSQLESVGVREVLIPQPGERHTLAE